MADEIISAQFAERQAEKRIRDCANPNAEPMVAKGRLQTVLAIEIGVGRSLPDEVAVNGVRYVPERPSIPSLDTLAETDPSLIAKLRARLA